MPTIDHPLALAAIITGLAALAFWLEGRFTWGRRIGSSMLIILGGALLSNLELVPVSSPVYSTITGPVTSLAIVWLLFAIDLRSLKAAGPRMLAAFGVAVVGTMAGAIVAVLLLGNSFEKDPDDVWRLSGVMTGTYAGGSVNFAAVGREVGLIDNEEKASILAAATAADNVMTAVWVGATLMLPIWLGGLYRRRARAPKEAPAPVSEAEAEEVTRLFSGEVTLRPVPLLTLLALGFLLILGARRLHEHVGLPEVLWLTALALVVGHVPQVRRLDGALQLGLIALTLFFAVIGIYSRVSEILEVGLEVFYFTVIVVLVHGVVTYAGAWLLRLDVETTSVASQAAVGGPSTAAALAVARGWRHLAVPGLMVGLLGYAVGNFAGLAIVWLVRNFLIS